MESVFGFVAKGTLALAAMLVVACMIFTGDLGGIADLPSSKKGWMRWLLALAVFIALVIAVRYFFMSSK